MIDFAQPWMLLGLLAAAVPVVVHLQARRRARRVTFTALRFLTAADPRRARAMRLREWLLLAVRTLAVVLLTLALARPLLPDLAEEQALVAAREPVGLALVIDNSLSMGLQDAEGVDRLEHARRAALRVLATLPEGSEVVVVSAAAPAQLELPRATSVMADAAAALRGLRAVGTRDDPSRALALADMALGASELADRRLLVLTDGEGPRWADTLAARAAAAEQAPDGSRAPPTLRVQWQREGVTEHTAIVSARASSAPELGPDQRRVQIVLRRHGETPWRGELRVRTGGREVRRAVEVPAGASVQTEVLVVVGDAVAAEVRLPPDARPLDDVAYALLGDDERLRVALVNGAPRPVPRDDEVFFAARALELGAERAGSLEVDTLAVADLRPDRLAPYDVIVLANVPELPAPVVDALQTLVTEQGRGLLVAAGDGMTEPVPAWVEALAPAPVVGVRNLAAGLVDARRGGPSPVLATGPDEADDAELEPAARLRARLLQLRVGPLLAQTRVYQHALLEPTGLGRNTTVLRLPDGAPLLVLERRGQGVVGLMATTLDRDWTDLPLQPVFLPVLSELVGVLAGARADRSPHVVPPRTALIWPRHPRATTLRRHGPGEQLDSQAPRRAAAARWRVEAPTEPGVYRYVEFGAGRAWRTRHLAVQAPADEVDDVAVAVPATLREQLSGRSARVAGVGSARALVPAQGLALALLFGLLLAEGVLLWRSSPARGTVRP